MDIFMHDSLHTIEHEVAELAAVGLVSRRMRSCSRANAHATDALMRWAEQSGRQFSFFRGQPTGHLVPGVWDRHRLALQGVRVADDVVRSGRSAVPVRVMQNSPSSSP